MAAYNGYRSWNAWNVSLWLNNDEGLYGLMLDAFETAGKKKGRAAHYLLNTLTKEGVTKTPDGGVYNLSAIRGAMEGLE